MSKLYFFRHAQASMGAENYDVLSNKGEEQAIRLGNYLVDQKIVFDQIFVGPLVRQKHTLELVKKSYSNSSRIFPNIIQLKELQEHQGMEAMQIALPQLYKTDPYLKQLADQTTHQPSQFKINRMLSFQYFMSGWVTGKFNVPEVRSWSSFMVDVQKALGHILNSIDKGQTVGVFTSGGTISAITAQALELQNEIKIAELNFSVRNSSISTFFYSQKKFNLLAFNELPHLDNNMITFV